MNEGAQPTDGIKKIRGHEGREDVVYSLRDIKKSYSTPGGRLEVLKGIDLEIMRGEFVLIEGRSGIGKSTLLHVMGLLDRPDSGTLHFEGTDLARISARRRASIRATRVSFVFQFFHLLPEFSALDNVMMPGRIANGVFEWFRARRDAKDRAKALLESVGLGARMHHRPNQLSGGERQRVALARSLFSDPSIVLCDEPTGNLDVRTADEIHELLARLYRDTGKTFVVVSHDRGLRNFASRIIGLEDGRVARDPEVPSVEETSNSETSQTSEHASDAEVGDQKNG